MSPSLYEHAPCIRYQSNLLPSSRPLTAGQQEKVLELATRLSAVKAYVSETHDHHMLARFLRARQWDLEEAQKMWVEQLAWRKQERVDTISKWFVYPEKEHQLRCLPAGLHKVDKEGHPVLYQQLGRANLAELYKVTTEEKMKRFHIQQKEHLLEHILPACSVLAQKHLDQVFSVIDLQGISFMSLPKVKNLLMMSMKIDNSNYPETLAHMCIINAPGWFSATWATAKGLLSKDTVNKIEILSTNYQATLLKYINADNLLQEYGGRSVGRLADNIGPWQPIVEQQHAPPSVQLATPSDKQQAHQPGHDAHSQQQPQGVSCSHIDQQECSAAAVINNCHNLDSAEVSQPIAPTTANQGTPSHQALQVSAPLIELGSTSEKEAVSHQQPVVDQPDALEHLGTESNTAEHVLISEAQARLPRVSVSSMSSEDFASACHTLSHVPAQSPSSPPLTDSTTPAASSSGHKRPVPWEHPGTSSRRLSFEEVQSIHTPFHLLSQTPLRPEPVSEPRTQVPSASVLPSAAAELEHSVQQAAPHTSGNGISSRGRSLLNHLHLQVPEVSSSTQGGMYSARSQLPSSRGTSRTRWSITSFHSARSELGDELEVTSPMLLGPISDMPETWSPHTDAQSDAETRSMDQASKQHQHSSHPQAAHPVQHVHGGGDGAASTTAGQIQRKGSDSSGSMAYHTATAEHVPQHEARVHDYGPGVKAVAEDVPDSPVQLLCIKLPKSWFAASRQARYHHMHDETEAHHKQIPSGYLRCNAAGAFDMEEGNLELQDGMDSRHRQAKSSADDGLWMSASHRRSFLQTFVKDSDHLEHDRKHNECSCCVVM